MKHREVISEEQYEEALRDAQRITDKVMSEQRKKEDCAREYGHEFSLAYNEGQTCMRCGDHRQMYYKEKGGLSPEPGPIDRAFVLRLYATHEKIMTDIHNLSVALAQVGSLGMMENIVEFANRLDYEVDQLECIFGEVLTDAERGIMTDEEMAQMLESK